MTYTLIVGTKSYDLPKKNVSDCRKAGRSGGS